MKAKVPTRSEIRSDGLSSVTAQNTPDKTKLEAYTESRDRIAYTDAYKEAMTNRSF